MNGMKTIQIRCRMDSRESSEDSVAQGENLRFRWKVLGPTGFVGSKKGGGASSTGFSIEFIRSQSIGRKESLATFRVITSNSIIHGMMSNNDDNNNNNPSSSSLNLKQEQKPNPSSLKKNPAQDTQERLAPSDRMRQKGDLKSQGIHNLPDVQSDPSSAGDESGGIRVICLAENSISSSSSGSSTSGHTDSSHLLFPSSAATTGDNMIVSGNAHQSSSGSGSVSGSGAAAAAFESLVTGERKNSICVFTVKNGIPTESQDYYVDGVMKSSPLHKSSSAAPAAPASGGVSHSTKESQKIKLIQEDSTHPLSPSERNNRHDVLKSSAAADDQLRGSDDYDGDEKTRGTKGASGDKRNSVQLNTELNSDDQSSASDLSSALRYYFNLINMRNLNLSLVVGISSLFIIILFLIHGRRRRQRLRHNRRNKHSSSTSPAAGQKKKGGSSSMDITGGGGEHHSHHRDEDVTGTHVYSSSSLILGQNDSDDDDPEAKTTHIQRRIRLKQDHPQQVELVSMMSSQMLPLGLEEPDLLIYQPNCSSSLTEDNETNLVTTASNSSDLTITGQAQHHQHPMSHLYQIDEDRADRMRGSSGGGKTSLNYNTYGHHFIATHGSDDHYPHFDGDGNSNHHQNHQLQHHQNLQRNFNHPHDDELLITRRKAGLDTSGGYFMDSGSAGVPFSSSEITSGDHNELPQLVPHSAASTLSYHHPVNLSIPLDDFNQHHNIDIPSSNSSSIIISSPVDPVGSSSAGVLISDLRYHSCHNNSNQLLHHHHHQRVSSSESSSFDPSSSLNHHHHQHHHHVPHQVPVLHPPHHHLNQYHSSHVRGSNPSELIFQPSPSPSCVSPSAANNSSSNSDIIIQTTIEFSHEDMSGSEQLNNRQKIERKKSKVPSRTTPV